MKYTGSYVKYEFAEGISQMAAMTTTASLLRNLLVVLELDLDSVRARLKEARKKAGFTQEQAAGLLEVHKGTVENDEGRGEASNALWGRLNKYARAYNCPLEWFLWGDEVIVHERAQSELLEDLAGRLGHFVDRLEFAVDDLEAPQRGRAQR